MLKNTNYVPNFFGETIPLNSVKFFFLFCPNNSGTTVLSQYLASQIDSYLPPYGNFEGQMAPTVKSMMRGNHWQKNRQFDWSYIRESWESLAAGKMFIEASPPNLIRSDQIQSFFGSDSTALVSICDPYQHISSSVRRYHRSPKKFQIVARSWVQKAREIIGIRRAYPFFPFINYEDFVSNPRVINEWLKIPFRDLKIAGKKGSNISGIRSGYVRSIGFLRSDDVISINKVLRDASEVMNYFGYALNGPNILKVVKERDPEEFWIGSQAREEWDKQ